MTAEARKVDEWMPLFVDKYLGDTTHLTTELHGAYLLLLMAGWKRGGRLPADDTQLAAIARMTPAKWRSAKSVLLAFFRRDEGGGLVQKRLTNEVERARRLSIVRAEAGQIGGRSRSKPASKTEANAKQTAKQNSKQNASNDEANWVANTQANVMQKGDTGGSPPSAPNPHTYQDPSLRFGSLESSLRSDSEKTSSSLSPAAKNATDDGGAGSTQGENPNTLPGIEPEPEVLPEELPDCPHTELIALYAKHLPELAQPRVWTNGRAAVLRQRWRDCAKPSAYSPGYRTKAEGLQFWERYFAHVARETRLAKGFPREGGRVWLPDLPWLIEAEHFAKIVEGAYS